MSWPVLLYDWSVWQRCVAIGRHKSGIDDTTHTQCRQAEAADLCDNSQQKFWERIKHHKTSKDTRTTLWSDLKRCNVCKKVKVMIKTKIGSANVKFRIIVQYCISVKVLLHKYMYVI